MEGSILDGCLLGSLWLAALPHLPLVMLPLCPGKSWGLRKQRTDLLLPAGDKGVRKPGLAHATPRFWGVGAEPRPGTSHLQGSDLEELVPTQKRIGLS